LLSGPGAADTKPLRELITEICLSYSRRDKRPRAEGCRCAERASNHGRHRAKNWRQQRPYLRTGCAANSYAAPAREQHHGRRPRVRHFCCDCFDVVGESVALSAVDAFLSASFEGGRHADRVALISALDREAR
jgi:hypothetical protein